MFNEYGISDTTLRKISGNLDMSQGNLNYHFKSKQDLVVELYFDLVEEMNVNMQAMPPSNSLIHSLYESSRISLDGLYKYRFLLRDFYKIMREEEKIRDHYHGLQQIRAQQFLEIFKGLVAAGIMRGEEFEHEFDRLFLRMNILGDNWINAQELLKGNVPNPVDYYNDLLFEIIYPYLTFKGKQEFNSLPKRTQ